jgi:hypothetical protein
MIAFGGLSWASTAPLRPREPCCACGTPWVRPALAPERVRNRHAAREIRFRNLSFAYPKTAAGPRRFRSDHSGWFVWPSLARITGKTTLAKLLCRLRSQQGAIEIDGVDLRELDVSAWRAGWRPFSRISFGSSCLAR